MPLKNLLLTVLGACLILLGIVLIVTPFPGILLVIAGLGCLSVVYEKPKSLLRWCQKKMHYSARKIDKKRIQKKLYH